MTRDEYQHYSDCRQASFTYRKGVSTRNNKTNINSQSGKRFREFLNLPPHLDLKQNDDTIDIVGFLAFEMVRALTIGGLNVKRSLESRSADVSVSLGVRKAITGIDTPNKKARVESPDAFSAPLSTLFLPPPEARTALRPEHIQDSFSRMQRDWAHTRTSGMRNWRGGLIRTGVALI
jgi:transcription initiation protein SPT3